MMSELLEIPQPPTHLFGYLGNFPDINPGELAPSFFHLMKLYGPIYQLELGKRRAIILTSCELAAEAMDEKRFEKVIAGQLGQVRNMVGDGLFTAHQHEPVWHLAHKLLMPVFGPVAIRKYFPDMVDIASQLFLKWDRMGNDVAIDVTDSFTRLTFDTIGLSAFNFRFNDFYSDDMHPFATWMADVLLESTKRANRTGIENAARVWSAETYWKNISNIHELCDRIVAERKANPRPEINDLLNVMLTSRDPATGEGLSDENIRNQMGTFLIAGHETTSGTLSFALYELLKQPNLLHKARKEVDDIIGNKSITAEDLPKLKYIDAILKETLRLRSTIAFIPQHAKEATTLGGRYRVTPEDGLTILLPGLHRDPKVYGDDASIFRPERMLDGGFERIPRGGWLPFGSGMRACIGRAFAEQEMQFVLALLLQQFTIQMDDPTYVLQISNMGTMKPKGFKIRVKKREGAVNWLGLGSVVPTSQQGQSKPSASIPEQELSPVTVLYGSNAGTCKSLADDLESSATANGFKVSTQTMDAGAEHLPKDHPVIIVTPSYEGEPADNAKLFVSWLESHGKDPELLKGVSYTVFGAGNSDWPSTFHRIPKLVHDFMQKMGAKNFHEPGFADAKGDLIGTWDSWRESLWESLRKSNGKEQSERPELVVNVSPSSSTKILGGSDVVLGTVKENYELCGTEAGLAKRHMVVELPQGLSYHSGDYLSVLPFNEYSVVLRVLRRFDLSADDEMQVSGSSKSFLPTEKPESIFDFLSKAVELHTPATQAQIRKLVAATGETSQKSQLERYATTEHFTAEVFSKRKAVIDLLEQFPACILSFSQYVDMLQPIGPRQYSISSSPLADLANPNVLTISYDVLDAPALFNGANGVAAPRFHGVASSYLARVPVGGKLRCAVRPTNIAFHLPSDTKTPVIMIAAGTGLAPMRGFIQERAAIAAAQGGAAGLGPAVLFFGCRDPEKDFLYKDELHAWEKDGVVQVRPTFSRGGEVHADKTVHKYVSDRIWAEREELRGLFRDGAKILLCGSASKVGNSVKEVLRKIYKDGTGKSEEEAVEWLRSVSKERFVSDLFD